MKAGRFSESQIVAILKQQDSGQTVAHISREHGISEATFYAWKAKFDGTFRREVLNANAFSSLTQVRQTVDAWLVEYNTERPHQALKFMTPVEYRQAA